MLISARQVTSVRRQGPPDRPYESDRAFLEKSAGQVAPLGDAWMQSFILQNQPLLRRDALSEADSAATVIQDRPQATQRRPGNSVSDGNDVGALVGQPMNGRGSVQVGVEF